MSQAERWQPPVVDPNQPYEVAPRLWWVGHYQPDDAFQCHVYLLEQGDQSVLFDPGSKLTFRHTLRKIEQIIPFSKIRYFVCHHQDPDITGALDLIDAMVARDDAVIITHWRAEALLRHYALELPFWRVEDHDWQLPLEDRTLRFVFTPYAHFPGAFCTFDEGSNTLLSSDLFGGFTEGFQLYAPGESYFEQLRPFHEHYIPGRDVLLNALDRIEQHPIDQIAPQHGSIIPGHLVPFMLNRLKEIDCGLYLLADKNTDLLRLSRLNKALQDVTQALIVNREFVDVVRGLSRVTGEVLGSHVMRFWSQDAEGQVLYLGPENRHRGKVCEPPQCVADVLGRMLPEPHAEYALVGNQPVVLRPLTSEGRCHAVFALQAESTFELDDEAHEVIDRIAGPITVALERESVLRMLELARQSLYERAVRDPLTQLHTRRYMYESVGRQLAMAERHPEFQFTLLMLDLDHFKSVNDTFGHPVGDKVLAAVGGVLLANVREGDLSVRLGGEEFALFAAQDAQMMVRAERIRVAVSELVIPELQGRRITVSIGAARYRPGEDLETFMGRADRALYAAKHGGRNRVISADTL